MSDGLFGREGAIGRLIELAEAQCTDAEVSGALASEFSVGDDAADNYVATQAAVILRHRMRGRAVRREHLARLAAGDREMGKTWTRSNIAALELFGRQHLGYTGDGMDAKVRKYVERAERKQAHAKQGLRAV